MKTPKENQSNEIGIVFKQGFCRKQLFVQSTHECFQFNHFNLICIDFLTGKRMKYEYFACDVTDGKPGGFPIQKCKLDSISIHK